MNITSKGAMMAQCLSPEFTWHSYSAKNNNLRDYGSGKLKNISMGFIKFDNV